MDNFFQPFYYIYFSFLRCFTWKKGETLAFPEWKIPFSIYPTPLFFPWRKICLHHPPPSLPIPLFMHLFIQDSPLLISAKCVQHPVHYHPYYGLQRRLYYANTSLTKTSSPSYLQSFAFKCRNSDKIKKDVNFIKQNIIILKTLVSFLKANITILCSLKNVQF